MGRWLSGLAALSTGYGRRASNASLSNSTVTASLHRRQAGLQDADAPQACLRPTPPLRDSCIRVGQRQNPAAGPSLPHHARRTPLLVQNSVPWPSESESRWHGDCVGWRRRATEYSTRRGRGGGQGLPGLGTRKRTRAGPPGRARADRAESRLRAGQSRADRRADAAARVPGRVRPRVTRRRLLILWNIIFLFFYVNQR
jgi:hypothetical protein